jgi:hypothetical protein
LVRTHISTQARWPVLPAPLVMLGRPPLPGATQRWLFRPCHDPAHEPGQAGGSGGMGQCYHARGRQSWLTWPASGTGRSTPKSRAQGPAPGRLLADSLLSPGLQARSESGCQRQRIVHSIPNRATWEVTSRTPPEKGPLKPKFEGPSESDAGFIVGGLAGKKTVAEHVQKLSLR